MADDGSVQHQPYGAASPRGVSDAHGAPAARGRDARFGAKAGWKAAGATGLLDGRGRGYFMMAEDGIVTPKVSGPEEESVSAALTARP